MLGYKNKLIPTLALKKLSFMGNSEKIIITGCGEYSDGEATASRGHRRKGSPLAEEVIGGRASRKRR